MAPLGDLSLLVPSQDSHVSSERGLVFNKSSDAKTQKALACYETRLDPDSTTEDRAGVGGDSGDTRTLRDKASPQQEIPHSNSETVNSSTDKANVSAPEAEDNLPAAGYARRVHASGSRTCESGHDESTRTVANPHRTPASAISPNTTNAPGASNGTCLESSSNNTEDSLQGSPSKSGTQFDSVPLDIAPSSTSPIASTSSPEVHSPTTPHTVTSTDLINPIGFLRKNRESSRSNSTPSDSDKPKSAAGGLGNTFSRIKSPLTSSNSKDAGQTNNFSSPNKSSQGNTTPKSPFKGRQSAGSDGESTPLVPEGRRPQRPPEENSLETMAGENKEGSRFFVYYLSCFATIGGLLFGYDTGIVSGSMLLIEDYFSLTTIWKELIVSGTVGAAAVFALIAGFVCDYMGRKVSIMLASLVFAGGAVVMGAANSKEMLLGGRIIVGIGIGFASMTVPVYVAEAAPTAIRGRLVTLNQLFITIGILVSALVAGGFSSMKETGWRYMLGLAGVPGIIQFVGFLYLPESPRWLVTKGREDEARDVLRRIRDKQDVEEELEEIKTAVEESKKESGFVLGRVMSTPHVRRALFVGCGLQIFQQLCGINTVIYYSGTILKMAGFPAEQAIWLVTIPFSINFLCTIMGVVLVERLGRKRLLVVSFIGVTIALIVLAVGFQLSDEFSPSIDRNITETYRNGSVVVDDCISKQFSTCEECIEEKHCGFCYSGSGDNKGATCLRADQEGDKEDERSAYGRCDVARMDILGTSWAHGYCPTDYTWMAVLGLTLFVMAFAPGLGPMPWTINSEIYPLWARGTGNAIATGCNWVCNLVVSLFFLTLTETITKYGAFWLFTGVCVLGLLFTLACVPETKNKTLEEMEDLFKGKKSNSIGIANTGYDKEIETPEVTSIEQRDESPF